MTLLVIIKYVNLYHKNVSKETKKVLDIDFNDDKI